MVKEFSSTLMLRRFTRELTTATAQSTYTKQFRVFSIALSLHTGSAGPIFQLIVTNPLSKVTQCMAVDYSLFYMNKLCDVRVVTAVLLASCHWVAIAEVSKQCITVILSNQVDGVEFFIPAFPNLFETSLSTPATTEQNPRE
jgi:hypothetical protein